jgi:hypothetical protein
MSERRLLDSADEIAKELEQYHDSVYRALRDDPRQPREAKSPTADMCKRAATFIRAAIANGASQ